MNLNSDNDNETHLQLNSSLHHKTTLTIESLAEQNKLLNNAAKKSPSQLNTIDDWVADLPELPQYTENDDNDNKASTCIFDLDSDIEQSVHDASSPNEACIQKIKDVFTETQKIAYIGLCYLTSLEIVNIWQDKESNHARMSAQNWQRRLMQMLYSHLEIPVEERKMIESLSQHCILPIDLVYQFTSQGDTTKIKINSINKDDSNNVIVDLRWTIICDLLLICLNNENYDARSRVFIEKLSQYLSLDWHKVIGYEKEITYRLVQDNAFWETETVTTVATTATTGFIGGGGNDTERLRRNKQTKKKRLVMIGLATVGGSLIMGLSAGLMAPVIAGGLGTILTTVGITGTGSFLGGTAGIALITGGATVAGGRKRMNKRMKTIRTFDFLPLYVDENVSCIISITGWLPSSDKDEAVLPFSTLDTLMGDHYSLFWEPEMLEELGSAFRIFATEAVTFSIQQVLSHTVMGALLSGLAFPLALTKLGYIVDNPWANALDRAKLAGLILADTLMNRNLGARPVTLIGYSLGARVIFYCLLELARVNAFGLVENVALFGTPVSTSESKWRECASVVSGRFINGYATNDWLLGFLFRTSTAGLGNIAGLCPLLSKDEKGSRIQNLNCTELISGHLSYRTCMPKLLKLAGFSVTSEELPVLKEKEKRNRFSFRKSEIKSKDSIDENELKQSFSESIDRSLSSLSLEKHELDSIIDSSETNSVSYPATPRSSNDKNTLLKDGVAAISSNRNSWQSFPNHNKGDTEAIMLTESKFSSNNKKKETYMDRHPRVSRIFSSNLFRNKTISKNDHGRKELEDAGIAVKEIKSTLGCLVVPEHSSHSLPDNEIGS